MMLCAMLDEDMCWTDYADQRRELEESEVAKLGWHSIPTSLGMAGVETLILIHLFCSEAIEICCNLEELYRKLQNNTLH